MTPLSSSRATLPARSEPRRAQQTARGFFLAALIFLSPIKSHAGAPDYPEYGTHYLAAADIGTGPIPQAEWNNPVPEPVVTLFEPLGTKTAAIGCQVLDVATTEYALHHNQNATEANPGGRPFAYGLKVAVVGGILIVPQADWDSAWLPLRVFVTALGCGAAINNIRVARESQPEPEPAPPLKRYPLALAVRVPF